MSLQDTPGVCGRSVAVQRSILFLHQQKPIETFQAMNVSASEANLVPQAPFGTDPEIRPKNPGYIEIKHVVCVFFTSFLSISFLSFFSLKKNSVC